MAEDNHERDRIVDLSAKKTESEWALSAQGFFEKFTPLWFKWIGWIFAVGGIAFLSQQTGSIVLEGLETISYVLLFQYFIYFFASIRIEP